MIRDHFSLNAWHPFGDSQFWLIRVDADWCTAQPTYRPSKQYLAGAAMEFSATGRGWFSVTVALLGFGASLTYWPESKGNVPSNS